MNVVRIPVLNIYLDNWTRSAFIGALTEGLVFTPNLDHLSLLQRRQDFYEAYQQASHIVCDSRILLIAARLLGWPVADQIAGADLLPAWCQAHGSDPGVRVFLLGGTTAEAARRAAMHLDTLAGRAVVCGVFSPPRGFESDDAQLAHIQQLIQDAGATVVAVGVGAPKQELWITRHKALLPQVRLWMAVGATIDFLGGYRRRAPAWMTRIGLEWAYRLVQEPGRLARRYLLDDLPVLGWLLLQRLGLYRNPWAS